MNEVDQARSLLRAVWNASEYSKAAIERYKAALKRLSFPERTLWDCLGEGDPQVLNSGVLIFRLTTKAVSSCQKNIKDCCAPWPVLPPYTTVGEGSELIDCYACGNDLRDIFAEWRREENQQWIVRQLQAGIDSNLGIFQVPVSADGELLRELISVDLVPYRRQSIEPIRQTDVVSTMIKVVHEHCWIMRFAGSESFVATMLMKEAELSQIVGPWLSTGNIPHMAAIPHGHSWRVFSQAGEL